jgi:hypothetical protein
MIFFKLYIKILITYKFVAKIEGPVVVHDPIKYHTYGHLGKWK